MDVAARTRESEIRDVFRTLGLATEKDRASYLVYSQAFETTDNDKVIVPLLVASTEQVITKGIECAELERSPERN